MRVGPVLAAAFLIAGCSRQGVPQHLGILTLLRFGQLDASPAALYTGRVSFANGCASVEGPRGLPMTGLWPPDTRLDATSGRLLIVVQGVPFAEGDELSMGGGEYADEAWVESLVGPIPEQCRGPHYQLLTQLVPS